MKFQDKFYNIIDHNKCPSGEKSAEKCIFTILNLSMGNLSTNTEKTLVAKAAQ